MKSIMLFISSLSFLLFSASNLQPNRFSIIGTWQGEVDEIRANQIDSEKKTRVDTVFYNIKFEVTFNPDQTYQLRAKSLAENLLLNQYLKRMKLVKYNIYSTENKDKFNIYFINHDKKQQKPKNYMGKIKVINRNTINIRVTLDDRNKEKSIRLVRRN